MRTFVSFCGVIFLAATTAAQDRVVSLSIPEDFPTDLPVVVAGELSGDPLQTQTLALSHPQLGGQELQGQRESSGNRVWVALTATQKMLGKRFDLKVKAANVADSDSIVGIASRDGGYEFLEADRPVLFYQREPLTRHDHTRAGFVHPLRGLDGETLTEIFPSDHRHHQGVFWAWHQLWVGERKVGDPWVTKDHLVAVKSATARDDGSIFATLEVEADWISPLMQNSEGEPIPIVKERTQIRLFRARGNSQYVDFRIELRSELPDVKIGGSENVKGYSGFTVRVKPPAGMKIHDVGGLLADDNVQTPSAWAAVSGPFGEGKVSGVGILSHPSLVQFPPRWLLRHYGMQNVAYPGREPVALSADKPLVLRHRLVLHRGDTGQARVADHQRVFESTP